MTVFPPDIPTSKLIGDFKGWYIREIDADYCNERIELSANLDMVLFTILTGIGAGALHKFGSDLYEYIRGKLKERFSRDESNYPPLSKWGPGLIHISKGDYPNMIEIEGHPQDNAILEIGDVRPLFHIQKDYFLVLRNVTLKYVGDRSTLIKESSGPAFVPINVKFIQATHRENIPGEFQIRSPIWVGEPSKNPYSGQRRQDDFIDMYA